MLLLYTYVIISLFRKVSTAVSNLSNVSMLSINYWHSSGKSCSYWWWVSGPSMQYIASFEKWSVSIETARVGGAHRENRSIVLLRSIIILFSNNAFIFGPQKQRSYLFSLSYKRTSLNETKLLFGCCICEMDFSAFDFRPVHCQFRGCPNKNVKMNSQQYRFWPERKDVRLAWLLAGDKAFLWLPPALEGLTTSGKQLYINI